jgi:hypothetical protein
MRLLFQHAKITHPWIVSVETVLTRPGMAGFPECQIRRLLAAGQYLIRYTYVTQIGCITRHPAVSVSDTVPSVYT